MFEMECTMKLWTKQQPSNRIGRGEDGIGMATE